MSRVAHLADLHLGYSHLNNRAEDGRNQRLVDFEQAALLVAKDIVARQVDYVVIAGDLFHETNLYPAAMSGAVHFCSILNQAEIPIIVIGGNHDEAEGEGRYNSLRFLEDHHQVQLFLNQGYLDLPDLRLHLVSYRVISRANRARGELEAFQFATDRPNVLVSHGYAAGEGVPAIPEGMDTTIPDKWLDDARFSLVMLGHIHTHQEIRPHVFFAGSTERRNFGEVEQQPGYFIHTIDRQGLKKSESIFINQLSDSLPRPMASFSLDTSDKTVNEVARWVEDKIDNAPPGSMLRVVLQKVSPELDRSQLRLDWERRHKQNGGLYFESTVQTRRVSELLDIEFKDKPKDLNQGVIEFINSQVVEDKQRQEITELASEIIAEAQERVLSEGGNS